MEKSSPFVWPADMAGFCGIRGGRVFGSGHFSVAFRSTELNQRIRVGGSFCPHLLRCFFLLNRSCAEVARMFVPEEVACGRGTKSLASKGIGAVARVLQWSVSG